MVTPRQIWFWMRDELLKEMPRIQGISEVYGDPGDPDARIWYAKNDKSVGWPRFRNAVTDQKYFRKNQ